MTNEMERRPFFFKFSLQTLVEMRSISEATIGIFHNFAITIARIPEPLPMSRPLRGLFLEKNLSILLRAIIHPLVVSCRPEPKASPAGIFNLIEGK